MRLRSFFGVVLMTCLGMTAYSQTIIKPDAKIKKTSFAVITDTPTWQACGSEIKEYSAVLTSEGLPTFIVYDNWKSPEQVKETIQKLYKKSKLEGVVFIGDVPVAMVRKGQHLTSAFKMDEEVYPFFDSSVPSDRFYDDFDLKFDYLRQDSVHPSFFYYDLAIESPQQIKCDIYSGRIKGVGDEDHHAQISRYLKKAVAQHREANKLDQFFSYTGHGSYSNSLTAWTPEMYNLRQQMPGTFDSPSAPGRARFMRYSFSDYPKEDVMKMMRRDNLDLSIFHEHGVPERQYLSGIPQTESMSDHIAVLKAYFRSMARRYKKPEDREKFFEKYKNMGLDESWWSDYDSPEMVKADSIFDVNQGLVLEDIPGLAPNSRMVIFDACYNGDFREPDYIAGRYIMSPGKCVVTFANTVNVLQDKQANELLGILWLGARVGQWAQLTNILESHITGDPTYRFASAVDGIDASEILRTPYSSQQALELIKSEYADVRSAALHCLWANGYDKLPELLVNTFRTSDSPMERYTAMHLLEQLNGDEYRMILPEALDDTYEFIRRQAVSRMGKVGLDEYVPALVKIYGDDNMSARITFNVEQAMQAFDGKAVEKALAGRTDDAANALRKAHAKQTETNKSILGKEEGKRWQKLYISTLRNNPIHVTVPEYLALVNNPDVDEDVKLVMLDALAWYTLSYRRPEIMAVCETIMKQPEASEALKSAAQRTYYRLKN